MLDQQWSLSLLACGIPVISFAEGMSKDLIKNDFNGYLIKTKSSISLGNAIKRCLFINKKNDQNEKNSRKTAVRFLNLTKATQNFLNNLND